MTERVMRNLTDILKLNKSKFPTMLFNKHRKKKNYRKPKLFFFLYAFKTREGIWPHDVFNFVAYGPSLKMIHTCGLKLGNLFSGCCWTLSACCCCGWILSNCCCWTRSDCCCSGCAVCLAGWAVCAAAPASSLLFAPVRPNPPSLSSSSLLFAAAVGCGCGCGCGCDCGGGGGLGTRNNGCGCSGCCSCALGFGSCPSRLNPRPLYSGSGARRNGCGTACCGSSSTGATAPRPGCAAVENRANAGRCCWANATATINDVANTICEQPYNY